VSVLLPQHGTALTVRGNFSMKVWASQIEAASAHSYGAGQRMGIKYQLYMGRCNGPIRVVQKHRHESNISKRHQVGRYWTALRALRQSIRCSYKCTKHRNQASVRGCTQSYDWPYRLQRLAPTPALVFPRIQTPNLSYLKRQSTTQPHQL
jgi:hypothetical protein